MMLRFVAPTVLTLTLALPASAQEAAIDADALFDAMLLPELIGVMQQEGLAYGDSIGDDLLGGVIGPEWGMVVAQIYDLDRMTQTVREEYVATLEGADMAALEAFYLSDLGQQIVELELSAREAFLDEDTENAAREMAAVAMADETERYQLVAEFVEVNDLIERNVVGAMNSNYAFFTGLAASGPFAGELTDDQILSDVWSQEAEIRTSTSEWVFSYLMMAYQPLSDEELQAYIDFTRTEPGRIMNRALFDSFDDEFEAISWALGRAAAEQMMSEEL